MIGNLHKGIDFIDLGLIDYREAWNFQEEIFNRILASKAGEKNARIQESTLIFCEHPHVYTLGKSGDENNLLISKEFLKKIGATYYKTDRGGDITYHGPGQIVGYPVLDLEQYGLGLKRYIVLLETSIIDLLDRYGIGAAIKDDATGVWLDAKNPAKARKICAIGVRSGRYVTMHGFALNVNTDLKYFNYINPCGFTAGNVTSMEKELKGKQDIGKVKEQLRDIILVRLNSLER